MGAEWHLFQFVSLAKNSEEKYLSAYLYSLNRRNK